MPGVLPLLRLCNNLPSGFAIFLPLQYYLFLLRLLLHRPLALVNYMSTLPSECMPHGRPLAGALTLRPLLGLMMLPSFA